MGQLSKLLVIAPNNFEPWVPRYQKLEIALFVNKQAVPLVRGITSSEMTLESRQVRGPHVLKGFLWGGILVFGRYSFTSFLVLGRIVSTRPES